MSTPDEARITMNTMKCPHCEPGNMSEVAFGREVKQGRRNVLVEGLKRFQCDSCAGELVSRAQMKSNTRLIEEATDRAVVAGVNSQVLCALREKFDLTQKQASILFGAGESSFAKWESGQCAMSTPAALLVRCAVDVPGVLEHLAELRGHSLSCQHTTKNSGKYVAAAIYTQEYSAWEVFAVVDPVASHRKLVEDLLVRIRSSELDDDSEWKQVSTMVEKDENQSSSVARLIH